MPNAVKQRENHHTPPNVVKHGQSNRIRPTAPDNGTGWTSRHARCRSDTGRPSALAGNVDDDRERRHAETKRSRRS